MSSENRVRFSRSLHMGFLIAGAVGLATLAMAWIQFHTEQRTDQDDLDRRARLLAYQLRDTVADALAQPDPHAGRVLRDQLDGQGRLIGFAVFRADGHKIAAGKAIGPYAEDVQPVVGKVLSDSNPEVIETIRTHATVIHALAMRIADEEGKTRGVIVAVHDVTHLEERATARIIRYAFWIFGITFMLVLLVFGGTWFAYERPLKDLAEWMRRLRTDTAPGAPPVNLPSALLTTESKHLAESFRAARLSALADSGIVMDQKRWTRERLRAQAVNCLQGGMLVVVSNREPYMHTLRDGVPSLIMPAGGLVTALDPVLQACGGIWVAHGAGDADRQTADAHGRLSVPPGDGRYTLRRIWLTREEEQGYYYGLSNEGMWPLCHLAHERPTFRATDWEHYVEVNRRFALAILEEIGQNQATVLVQDYHLALVPQMLKRERPDLRVGLFWHIPWPNPDAIRICPWRAEILKGILGADLIGFHLQHYCNNFLDTVDRMLEAKLDWDHFAVELGGHRSAVRPFPISVESWAERGVLSGDALADQMAKLCDRHKLGNTQVVLGVDRIDYTKGLPERFRAIDRFLEKCPQHRGRIAFVQLGAPSRTHIRRYRDLISELESLADEINWKYQTDDWKPIRLLVDHHDASTVHAFMRLASICVVSSLHDGMNLVAKEYAMAKPDGNGVLILSEFAGAARELPDALIINPYDTEQFADALRYAAEMDLSERAERMQRMRQSVDERNVYWWAASFLTELCGTRLTDSLPGVPAPLART